MIIHNKINLLSTLTLILSIFFKKINSTEHNQEIPSQNFPTDNPKDFQNLLEYSGFDDFEVHRVSKRSVNSGINSRRRSLEPVIKLVHTLYVNQTKLSKVASKQANEIQILKTNQQRIGKLFELQSDTPRPSTNNLQPNNLEVALPGYNNKMYEKAKSNTEAKNLPRNVNPETVRVHEISKQNRELEVPDLPGHGSQAGHAGPSDADFSPDPMDSNVATTNSIVADTDFVINEVEDPVQNLLAQQQAEEAHNYTPEVQQNNDPVTKKTAVVVRPVQPIQTPAKNNNNNKNRKNNNNSPQPNQPNSGPMTADYTGISPVVRKNNQNNEISRRRMITNYNSNRKASVQTAHRIRSSPLCEDGVKMLYKNREYQRWCVCRSAVCERKEKRTACIRSSWGWGFLTKTFF